MRHDLTFSDRRKIAQSGRRQTRRTTLASVVTSLILLAVSGSAGEIGRVAPRTAPGPGAAGTVRPTIQYEEALAHAHDRIAFAPGARVTVGFKPRGSDRWTIAGGTPKALPAGRLTGKAMRDAAGVSPTDPAPSVSPTDPAP
jgi:hypothetical protein